MGEPGIRVFTAATNRRMQAGVLAEEPSDASTDKQREVEEALAAEVLRAANIASGRKPLAFLPLRTRYQLGWKSWNFQHTCSATRNTQMTPEQAETIANELIEHRRRAVTEAKNASARRVPFVYYVRGLNTLEPWERAELVEHACRHVANQWKFGVLAVVLVAACCLIWWLLGLFDTEDVPFALLVFIIAAASFFPRTYLVRQEIRRRLLRSKTPRGETPREV